MKHMILLLVMVLCNATSSAQKKQLIREEATIMARAAQALDAALQPGTDLHKAIVKENLIGNYVLQVSFRGKGDISSVFVVSAEAHDQRSQNRFKDLVHFMEMPFKMPKGRQYRIEHAFDLNSMMR